VLAGGLQDHSFAHWEDFAAGENRGPFYMQATLSLLITDVAFAIG
jgi:hypothetical protein